jgi:hypothetical protein
MSSGCFFGGSSQNRLACSQQAANDGNQYGSLPNVNAGLASSCTFKIICFSTHQSGAKFRIRFPHLSPFRLAISADEKRKRSALRGPQQPKLGRGSGWAAKPRLRGRGLGSQNNNSPNGRLMDPRTRTAFNQFERSNIQSSLAARGSRGRLTARTSATCERRALQGGF